MAYNLLIERGPLKQACIASKKGDIIWIAGRRPEDLFKKIKGREASFDDAGSGNRIPTTFTKK